MRRCAIPPRRRAFPLGPPGEVRGGGRSAFPPRPPRGGGGAFPPRPPRGGGFTLVELMVVIVVLMILTAMIIPQFGGTYQDALLRAHGRQILEALNLAYSQAVTTGKRVRLRVDPGRGRFWLEERGEEGDGGFHPVAGLPGGAGDLDPRISLEVRTPREGMTRAGEDRPEREGDQGESGEIQSVTFRPDGTAQAREILLRDRDGFSMALRIEASTARARVVQVERAQP